MLGDAAVPSTLLDEGIPSCAVTTISHMTVVVIASTAHLTV
ncbi:MAG: hypothetical protein ACRDNF_04600 [Streptosporangiaceae bacterium]